MLDYVRIRGKAVKVVMSHTFCLIALGGIRKSKLVHFRYLPFIFDDLTQ